MAQNVDSLLQVMKLISSLGSGNYFEKVSRKSVSLENLIKTTSDLDSMHTLHSRLKEYDEEWDKRGYDEEGDVLLNVFQNKYNVMQKGQMAFDKLSAMNIEGPEAEEKFNIARKKILDDDWSTINKDMQELYVLQSHLESAQKLGIKFKGGDVIAPESLKSVANQYQGFYRNKFNLLAQANVFDIPDEDIQAFDEEFGVALMTYAPADFARFMGGHQKKLESLYTRNESLTNAYYDLWKRSEAQGGASPALEGLPEYEEGDLVSAPEYKKRYDEYLTQTQKVNKRHNEFYKSYFSDNPRFIEGFKEEADFDLDKIVKDLKIEKDSEDQEEITPTLTITQDVRDSIPGGEITIKEATTKESLIQSGLSKIYTRGDISNSLKQIDFHRKQDGAKVNITSYDKERKIYKDVDGNEYKDDNLVISSDSLKDYRPKLKKANGDYYFFNPTKNQFTKWGSKGQGFDNQSYEYVNGKKTPVVYLATEYGEGIIIGGKTIKGSVTEKLLLVNGEWKHLKLDKGKWKTIKQGSQDYKNKEDELHRLHQENNPEMSFSQWKQMYEAYGLPPKQQLR